MGLAELRSQLCKLERLHDSYVEKWIVESADIIRRIGVKHVKIAHSWEDLGAIAELEFRLEEYTCLRASISELELRLDALATEYSEAVASHERASARVARLERGYGRQDSGSSVQIARRFFEKQWRYEGRVARTKFQMN